MIRANMINMLNMKRIYQVKWKGLSSNGDKDLEIDL